MGAIRESEGIITSCVSIQYSRLLLILEHTYCVNVNQGINKRKRSKMVFDEKTQVLKLINIFIRL